MGLQHPDSPVQIRSAPLERSRKTNVFRDSFLQKASGTTVLSFVNSSVIMSITTETKAYGFHAGKGIRMTIREEIEQLKKEKNAVILAHYYVRPEVQEIADYIGDSFYLSKVAVELEEQTIVFCGVRLWAKVRKC